LISDIRVEKSTLGLNSPIYATVDTGTSAIGVDATFWEEQLKPVIVKDNCKETRDAIECWGKLPDVIFLVKDIFGVRKELTLQDQDYYTQELKFLPVQGIYEETAVYLIFGTTILQKFYTEFNYRDRQINFAIRVKKKGDWVFWISLLAGVVFLLA